MIETAAAARQARVDRGDDVIVGVNKYRRQDEDLLETLEVDNAKVREGQIARINRVKASRDQAACDAALKALRDGARLAMSPQTVRPEPVEGPSFSSSDADEKNGASTSSAQAGFENNLLALAVEAARARATLGEISSAMEASFDRYGTQQTPVQGVYAAPSDRKSVVEGTSGPVRVDLGGR